MSGIACPFCQKKFQAQDLITHCRICRALQAEASSAGQQTKTDTQRSRQPVGAGERTSNRVSEDFSTRKVQDSSKRSYVQQEQESSPSRNHSANTPARTSDPAEGEESREECPHCGRRFISSRLEKHVSACAKLSTRRVPSFNPHDQRWRNVSNEDRQLVNEAEPSTPMSRSMVKSKTPVRKKLNWNTSDMAASFGQEKLAFNPTYDDNVAPQRPVQHSPPPPQQQQQSDEKPKDSVKEDRIPEPRSPERPKSAIQRDEPTDPRSVPDPAFMASAVESKHRHRHRRRHEHGHTPRVPSETSRYVSSTPGHTVPAYVSGVPAHLVQQPAQLTHQTPLAIPQLSTVAVSSGVPGLPVRIMATPPELCTFCIYCGLKFHPDAVFCGNCGSKRQSYDQIYGAPQ
ncbi:C2HC-type zinc-finger domain-containing protein [Giardia duodenalis]|uniref:C2HC-type zinc-finger domain-containing protein n=1 Tax=Giardia intestinalis (strain ATCC 50803 / WB clone C6) TaxID=184922 RepID=A8BKJ5_GIAIC|nr:C2HC-type zinc-finger domain-containing protein [Giardia intestinalis]KAE8301479.1 C2HC-type zinc-finger domain-containing protein [Giardia intestinalis]|eukprot:XP_001706542.1 Hypothetical protein GL50803_14069 [Giardia lamblia ATCC 50803]